MSTEPTSKDNTLEGDGTYNATARYNRHPEAIDTADLEASAENARETMDSPEREALARAAAERKQGPNTKGQTVAPTPKQARDEAKE